MELNVNEKFRYISPSPEFIIEQSLQRSAVFEITKPLGEKNTQKIDFRKWLNTSLFIIAVVVGAILVYISRISAYDIIGSMFFNGAFNPLVLSSWAIMTGAATFFRQNLIKSASSIIMFAVGIAILVTSNADVQSVLGQTFLEFGALFFISKFFFLVDDNELVIEKLERQLAEAKRSPGVGMALSYFYNFVVPTAANLSGEPQIDSINMEIARGQFETYTLAQSSLLVFVPRDLDGSDMKVFLRKISDDKSVIQGKPADKPGNGTHRAMFVYFMEWDATTKTCNHLMDIPTIISSIWNRAQDQKELKTDIAREILDFQNELITLINNHPLTRSKVRVISVPPLPLDISTLKTVAYKVLK